MPVPVRRGSKAIPALGIALAAAFLYSSRIEPPQLAASEEVIAAIDTSRLVSVQHVVGGGHVSDTGRAARGSRSRAGGEGF